MKKPLMQRPMLLLTLLAAPALALAARQAFAAQVAVHQTPALVPRITIPARSLMRVRRIANEFRIARIKRHARATRVFLLDESGHEVIFPEPRDASQNLRAGEYVRLRITGMKSRTIPARAIIDEFRVVRSLPLRLTLESVHGPRIRITQQVGIAESLAFHPGEIVWLKIPMVRP